MTLIYRFYHSRSVLTLKGAIIRVPVFCLFWFFSCALNIGVPPFMSFFSEALIFGSLRVLGSFELFFLFLLLFFSGVYGIFMYVLPSMGQPVFMEEAKIRIFFMAISLFLISPVVLFPFSFF